MKVSNLNELFLHELRDLYSAELQIIQAMPSMISAATDTDLKDALSQHLEETRTQLQRLETISEELDFKVEGHVCKGMQGVLKEASETMENVSDLRTKDAAIIIGGQRVEHYEMAAYGGAAEFADDIGYSDIANMLRKTLDEEGNADKKLTSLAKGGFFTTGINEEAVNELDDDERAER